MVSAASSNPQKPVLSYADSARKAQGIRTAASPAIQRRQPSTGPGPSSTNAVAPRAELSSPVIPPASAHVVAVTENTSSSTPSVPPEVVPSPPTQNGDASHSPADVSPKPSSAPPPKKSAPPPVNVWNVRKERLAQEKAQSAATSKSPRNPEPAIPNPKEDNHELEPTTVTESAEPAPIPAPTPFPAVNGSPKPNHDDANTKSSATSTPSRPPKPEDPWSLRSGPSQSAPPLPHLEDAAEWPEVGKGSSTASTPSLRGRNPIEKEKEEKEDDQGKELEHSQPRKSERTKWVPIPAEELQAAADAQRGPRRSAHSQPRSQHQGEARGQTTAQPTASTSASPSAPGSTAPSVAGGSNSKGQSRAQSSARDRQPSSRAPSTSQSQTQSRTGSVHSSPRHGSIRAKRLSDENGSAASLAANAGSRSMRSSRAPSPQPQNRPYPPVATLAGAPLPPMPAVPIVGVVPPPMGGESPRQPYIDARSVSPYYPVPAYPSYPPPPGTSSPNAAPYPLVAPGYPASPVPMPPPYPGAPPYPAYPAYAYPYGAPYQQYWVPPGATPDPNVPYPMVPPPHLAQLPPPIPDRRSQSITGSPSAAAPAQLGPVSIPGSGPQRAEVDASTSGQPALREGKEKRRARVMSFGSIVVAGNDSPAPGTPAPEAAEADPVLPNGQDSESSAAKTASRDDGTERAFAPTVIGVSASDPGNLKSQERAEGRTGKPEIATRSADVSPHGPKWEFGTTQHPEAEDEKFVYTTDNIPPTSAGPSTDQVSDQSTVGHSVPRSGAAEFVPAAELAARPALTQRPSDGDPFTVKNYGFGFGRRAATPVMHNQGMGRAEDQAYWRDRDGPPPGASGRTRRGSYAGANGFDRGYERGYRGRGRGRGYRGYSGRGGQRQFGGSPSLPSTPQKPAAGSEEEAAFYSTLQSPTMGFVAPYEPFGPYAAAFPPPATLPFTGIPPPAPVTKVSFPLDPLRYYLLGQLEYYVGADNLAHDVFLREKMDCRGWIPISIIASFNRVRQLTTEQELVKNVLALSSLVEVSGDWVRVQRWQQWILPTAPPSAVEPNAPQSGGSDDTSVDTENNDGAARAPSHMGVAEHVSQEGEGYTSPDYSGGQYGLTEYDYYPHHMTYPNAYSSGYIPAQHNLSQSGDPRDASGQSQKYTMYAGSYADDLGDEADTNDDESEELESDESDVEFVLGQEANGFQTKSG